MKPRLINAHMATARNYAELSYAKRLHVGAIVVKDDRIISIGYNGMPAGWDNDCEDKVWDNGAGGWLDPDTFNEKYPYEAWHDEAQRDVRYGLTTKPEVLHAERNALDKLAKGNEGGMGSTMFITHAPCLECSKSIYGAGITQVYYGEDYRSTDGIDFLTKCGVNIEKIE
jgi:dCMP deaminase